MNYRFLLISVILLHATYTFAGAPVWTWVKGPSLDRALGQHGAPGTSSPDNLPCARSAACSWLDKNGRIWIFGGDFSPAVAGYWSADGVSLTNNLWRYDPSTNGWTIIRQGADAPVYGTKNVEAPGNWPGNRYGAAAWMSADGQFWMFGGSGLRSQDYDAYLHNDLWRFNPVTGNWTWVKGSNVTSDPGVYGVLGQPAAANNPRARISPACWTDSAGRFWLLGGTGLNASGVWGDLNDLWRYDPSTNTWTWMKGSSAFDQAGVYGSRGVAAPANTPGARHAGAYATDSSGRLWLFGGRKHLNYYNDLWRFDPATNNWTWLKGSSSADQAGVYGVQGAASASNTPGARVAASAWFDDGGRFHLFGGQGKHDEFDGHFGEFCDLWRFDSTSGNWTWLKGPSAEEQLGVYGTQGIAAAGNNPGGRDGACALRAADGKVWLLGGSGYDAVGMLHYQNDLWRYDPLANQWAWIKGVSARDKRGFYGVKGVGAPANSPGARDGAAAWTAKDGKLWLFGGWGADGVTIPWRTDALTPFWLSPSSTLDWQYLLNDLWCFDPATGQWTWIAGSRNYNQLGEYWSAGGMSPGARRDAATWVDKDGQLWLFGGAGEDGYTTVQERVSFGSLNDLWRFDPATRQWQFWMGSTLANEPGPPPGARQGAHTWTGKDGKLWLYGGAVYWRDSEEGTYYDIGLTSDLWYFDKTKDYGWTWVMGVGYDEYEFDAPAVYGVKGVGAPANRPGARLYASTWTGKDGKLWLFGGWVEWRNSQTLNTTNGLANDLWNYDPVTKNWTWVKGPSSLNGAGVYGERGVAAQGNRPGARSGAASWTDDQGRLWLFGGYNYNGDLYTTDLWCYDPATNNWTWVSGGGSSQYGRFGAPGETSVMTGPGGRFGAATWRDQRGQMWLFGGWGYDAQIGPYSLNDLWKLTFPNAAENASWDRYK